METQEKSMIPAETVKSLENVVSKHEISVFDTDRMDALFKLATKISNSDLIPDHYRDKPSNCFLAMWKSERMGMDFHSFMQVSYVLKGKFGYEAKFVIARLNTSGKFKGPIRWSTAGEVKYDKRMVDTYKNQGNPPQKVLIKKEKLFVSADSTKSWTAFATLKSCDEKIEQTFYLKTAILNGWCEDADSKWNTMTEEKGQYQSAVFLGRMYAPEVIMDMQTREELEDIQAAETIDQTETGRDIFEKGVAVNTAADPVVDPTNMVAAPAEVVVENANANPPSASVVVNSEPVTTKLPPSMEIKTPVAPVEVTVSTPVAADKNEPQGLTPEELKKGPPTDPAPLRLWFLTYFSQDCEEMTIFLLGKKWLSMGEELNDLTDQKIKELTTVWWARIVPAFEKFKTDRKAGRA